MPTLSPETWTTITVIAALVFGGTIGRVWRPMRKAVDAIDALAGKPARYPGDPSERPGIAERLDRIDASISELRSGLAEVSKEVQSIETGCSE